MMISMRAETLDKKAINNRLVLRRKGLVSIADYPLLIQ